MKKSNYSKHTVKKSNYLIKIEKKSNYFRFLYPTSLLKVYTAVHTYLDSNAQQCSFIYYVAHVEVKTKFVLVTRVGAKAKFAFVTRVGAKAKFVFVTRVGAKTKFVFATLFLFLH